ncbi:MAG: DUF4132 domain-containing protein [Lachnospiraceae bacterium]|nr:DUF4132 domain-containing protein [Lachnospiraceae bacterium]
MAEFTYQTRRKITEDWVARTKQKAAHISKQEADLLPSGYYYHAVPHDTCVWMQKLLRDGTYRTLSGLYRGEFSKLISLCIPADQNEDFYYALDQMNQFQMTAGWYRRSVRSESYEPFVEASIQLFQAYTRLAFYGVPLSSLLTGNAPEEIYDHARMEYFAYAGILAAQIDNRNEETIQAVQDILLGEGNTAMISHELIRGIVMCKNRELYELLGKFLLAARLQEGARQAVCETMDAGRPEAFLHLFSVIEEHDLIRYSSVKRAVSTWIGIFNEKSIDRITEKLVRLMGGCLRDETFRNEQLATNDSVAISCALWALGFYRAEDAVEAVQKLVKYGTKNQKLTASYFTNSLQAENLKMQVSKEIVREFSDDLELVACFMGNFLSSSGMRLLSLAKKESHTYYSLHDSEVIEPKKLEPTELFDSREEARLFYDILKQISGQIPQKGLVFSPCIFPWYEVTLTQSDLAERMCLIAWMLQEDLLLDEAAKLIPLIGRSRYGSAGRESAARVLLYRPKSRVRRDILFDLMHNPEEYTCKSAFKLADDLTLTEEDYRKIEQNLKYKKGRAGTFALLKKQPSAQLAESIGRLLAAKSEECHMGALDLALQIKKEKPSDFALFLPYLSAYTKATGREQVLLQELTGDSSEAQDILQKPGYGFYDVEKEWVLPPMEADGSKASSLFTYGEAECIRVLQALNSLIEENRELTYKTAWDADETLGSKLEQCRWIGKDPDATPLDAYPFRELWENFYRTEIKTPRLLLEMKLYQECRSGRTAYEQNVKLYKKIFGSGRLKKPPFSNLVQGLRYGVQARTVLDTLFLEYVPNNLKAHFGLCGTAALLSVLDSSNDFYPVSEKRWNGEIQTHTERSADLPILGSMRSWLRFVSEEDWGSAFTLCFLLQQYYLQQRDREQLRPYQSTYTMYLSLLDYVQCYVRGFWDKDLFYKAIFTFSSLSVLLEPVSIVEQKGTVSSKNARIGALNSFFGTNAIVPVDGKFRFDNIGTELPAMELAHEIYREVVPAVLKVELRRGEQPTPFSGCIGSIQVIYGIDYMIQILTALGKEPLQRGYSYYTDALSKRKVLSHLLKVSMPGQDETAADLAKALKGTDITRKRLVELAMYAEQWIPMLEEYFKLPGFASACYYFMAHTSEYFDDHMTSVIARYTPLSPEELHDGAFDLNWFFEAYKKVGEKNFKLLYDAAKYSSSGTAHGRARKYADAALGKKDKEALKAEIDAKRNKDLLMSLGLLPLPAAKTKREKELLDRYQFIQKFKKESRQFGAQRRASEGRAVDIALRNLSVNAGFTDVTRLILRMESKLVEQASGCFAWQPVEGADGVELMIAVDENGKSTLKCRKNGKALKSVPTKLKKNELTLVMQETNKALKDQYSRTKQMLEQAMEDRTSFEVWELLELFKNPVVAPMLKSLLVMLESDTARLGFLTADGMMDYQGTVTPVKSGDKLLIAHPYDLYCGGHWSEYQKLLFEKQLKQPFKQIFRELYVKLSEELEKEESMLFSGNQIQPQKTVGVLRGRRWVADYDDGLQKVYYKENIVARIYAMADWFSPSDVEAPTLEWVVFLDRKTGKPLKIKDIPDIIYSEVMRDVDLAVSVAHAGGVDPETSHSTIEMRCAIVECNLELFGIKNVKVEGNFAIIHGKLGEYTVHLGSGVVHQMGNAMLFVVPVHSQHRGRIFLPFVDDDPKTAEIMSKILLFAEDTKIKDPSILAQIR